VSLLRYAREGGCVALLADHREGRGVAAPFFGTPAPSNPFPALVARSVNAPLYVFRAKRLQGIRFSVRIAQAPCRRPKIATRMLRRRRAISSRLWS
jgi:Kdo2-lipid IVA lauroyltransferase/acyltransferase